jgi:hypothetical protein
LPVTERIGVLATVLVLPSLRVLSEISGPVTLFGWCQWFRINFWFLIVLCTWCLLQNFPKRDVSISNFCR